MKSKNIMSISGIVGELRRTYFPKSQDFSGLYEADELERRVIARFSRDRLLLLLQQKRRITREQIEEGLKRGRETTRKYNE